MSKWTYISGSAMVSCRRFYTNVNGDLRIPYPEEQLKLGKATIDNYSGESYLAFDLEETSLPIIKRRIADVIKLLPNGESSCIDYSIYQSKDMPHMSSSDFDSKDEEEWFKKLLLNAGYHPLQVEEDIKLSWTEAYDEAVLTIHDSVRYCDLKQMLEQLTKFYVELNNNGIHLESGQFDVEDSDEKYRLSIRFDFTKATICVYDFVTDELVGKKVLEYLPHKKSENYDINDNQNGYFDWAHCKISEDEKFKKIFGEN